MGNVNCVLVGFNLNVAEMKKLQLLTVGEDFSTSGPFNVGTFD